MKIDLQVLIPELAKVVGSKEVAIEFPGETVHDLFEHLVARYGRQARRALYDHEGQLIPIIQVLRNGEEWITHDRLDTVLHDRDSVMLMILLGGG